ncbi:MAG: metallophosphoesterase [Lachnospiraceae bacterium]|nr:metallophosphoesterase [Lachnospiraceae bacterium]MCI9059170.1 metallophosphoesterase [Lachnospiraceae bacterium]
MKILAIADEESKGLWEYFDKKKLEGVDLIISCGDLDPAYLSFLVTLTSIPVLYVHGNHDGKYEKSPPDGCICIEDQIYVHKGIRILGLGGSMRYSAGTHQYTERQMKQRAARLRFQIFRRRGFDILVTHAPAYQLNDGRDLPHQGFQVFRRLLEKYRPKFFLHGHVHLSYGVSHKRYDKYEDTHVINAYERCVFEFEDENPGESLSVM